MTASINSLWYSIGKAMEWSFETFLVPIADPINLLVLLLSCVGGLYWLKMQKDYNEAAKNNNTIK